MELHEETEELSTGQRVLRAVTSRMFVRTAFLLFFIYVAVSLWRFAEWARGNGPYVTRPESFAGLIPIGHYTSFFAWLKGGGWDTYLPAGLIIILAAIAVSFLFKRGFCGWVCPLGTVWELGALAGRKVIGKNLRLPRWLDWGGRGFRYLIAAALLLFIASVPLAEALAFRELPYMWVADIKILETLFEPVMLLLFGLSFVISMLFGALWCRWLCPLGGLYSLFGVVSPCAVKRDSETCIACGACTETCHAFVDVQHASTVRDTECDGCMDCVRACPVDGCLEGRALGSWRIHPYAWMALVVGLWLGIYAVAKVTGYWDTTIPDELFRQIINSGLLEQQTPGGF
jgi:polyferredoxin